MCHAGIDHVDNQEKGDDDRDRPAKTPRRLAG
jgi:hypothetical protein